MLYLGEGLEWLVIVAFNGREMRLGGCGMRLWCVWVERERERFKKEQNQRTE